MPDITQGQYNLLGRNILNATAQNTRNLSKAFENNDEAGAVEAQFRNATLTHLISNRPGQNQILLNSSALSQLSNGLATSPFGFSLPAPTGEQQQSPFIQAGVEAYQQNFEQFPGTD